jgi:uncharacterized membrane protein YbaN (DUF454 family)
VTLQHEHSPAFEASFGASRWLLLATGFLFVGLAALGAVLPILPTTPFLLVAAACFARSSPRFYQWLLSNPTFGPLIREWRENRSIPLRAKLAAIALITLVGGTSVGFFISNPWLKLGVGAFLVGLVAWLVRLPTSEQSRHSTRSDVAARIHEAGHRVQQFER